MRLPNADSALVPREKLTRYILSSAHPTGRAKAQFFIRFGFAADSWETLAAALVRHAADHDVVKADDTPFGTRYTVEGPLGSPDGRNPTVRAVWFIEEGETVPRFVTAYPCEWRGEQ